MMLFLEKTHLSSFFKIPKRIEVFGLAKRPCMIQVLGHQVRELGHQVQACIDVHLTECLFMAAFISLQVLTWLTFQFM
jgi:hypothetical protein